jgi:hypothetical protein
MNHWVSNDGGAWSGPTMLVNGNQAASVPCAIALADGSVHVFAIANGGGLTHWRSSDGSTFTHDVDQSFGIPGGWNGLAVASPGGQRLDVFATTQGGIVQFTYDGNTSTRTVLPGSGGLPVRLLEAVSAAPGTIDVFAVDPNIRMPVRWHFAGTWSAKQIIGGGAAHSNSGLAAVVTAPSTIELFAITPDAKMGCWSIAGSTFTPRPIPAASAALPEGIPAAVTRGSTIDVFAIGQGGPFQGGPLVHWTFDGSMWNQPLIHSSGLAAGGVTALRGRGGLEAFGIQSGASNVLLHWPSGIAGADHDSWKNWAGNRQTNPEGHCRPQSLDELVAIVVAANRHGKSVRAVGSSWSFSDIAVTSGYLVETNQLNRVLTHVLPQALVANPASVVPIAGVTPMAKNFIHVECGIILEDLMTLLDARGLAPATMGGAAGQTLAGVISTSVHGSQFRLPPIPDWVRAIHLVGPDGRQYWIEPEDRPITIGADNDRVLQAALGPDVTIKRNNDWFDATLVTVGSLGIVYSVVLEVRDAYKLRETRSALPWSELRRRLANGTVFTDMAPEAVQMAIDPGSMAKADPDCFLTVRENVPMAIATTAQGFSFDPLAAFCEGHSIEALYRVASPAVLGTLITILMAMPVINVAVAPLVPILSPIIATDQAIPFLYTVLKAGGPGAVGDFLALVCDKNPGLTALLISEITRGAQAPVNGAVDLAHQVMARKNQGECAARGLALEVAFDATAGAHLAYIDAAIALLQREAAAGRFLGGWFSMRFVGKSRAVLSPQQNQTTCMVEYTALRGLSSTRPILTELEALARSHGGIQHWAMCDDLGAADVTRAYPRLETWRQVHAQLTGNGANKTFDNAFTDRCGLSLPPGRPASQWESLGGATPSRVAALSWAPNRLDLFVRGTDDGIWHKWWDGRVWNGWESLGGTTRNPVTAVSWGPNRLDLFVRGTDDAIWHKWWDGQAWNGWESLGGATMDSIAAVSWAANRLDLFVRGTDNGIWHKWWDGASWGGWESLGGATPSPVAAVSWGPNRLDLFVRGTDNGIWHKWWDGASWGGWESLGGGTLDSISAVSWAANRLDLAVRGTDNGIWHQSWDGRAWSGWESLGGATTSPVSTVAWGPNRLDLFVRGTDNTVYHKWWDGATWGPSRTDWEARGGGTPETVAAVAWSANRVDLFLRGNDNVIAHDWWDGAQWLPQ